MKQPNSLTAKSIFFALTLVAVLAISTVFLRAQSSELPTNGEQDAPIRNLPMNVVTGVVNRHNYWKARGMSRSPRQFRPAYRNRLLSWRTEATHAAAH